MRKIIFLNEGAGWICPDCGAHLDYKREPHDCEEPENPKEEKKPEPKAEPKTQVNKKTGQLSFVFETSSLKEALISTGKPGERKVTSLKHADGTEVADLDAAKESGDLMVGDDGKQYVFSPNGRLVPVKGSSTEGLDHKFIKKKGS